MPSAAPLYKPLPD